MGIYGLLLFSLMVLFISIDLVESVCWGDSLVKVCCFGGCCSLAEVVGACCGGWFSALRRLLL